MGCENAPPRPPCVYFRPCMCCWEGPPWQEKRLEQCGGAGSSCSMYSCLPPSPGSHFSLLCWPYSFTEHSLCCTQRQIFPEYSPFPLGTPGEPGTRIMYPHTGIKFQTRGAPSGSPERRQPRARERSWVLKDALEFSEKAEISKRQEGGRQCPVTAGKHIIRGMEGGA